ncbi:MAG: hypothetical protein ACE5H4_07935 [Candidatus Thorarchaeota archaeon]
MTRTLDEAMKFLENHTVAWHHWLLVLTLLELGGNATKGQIFPVYRKEGFSNHVIHQVFKNDLKDLGEVVEVEGDLDNLSERTIIHLTEDLTFRRFVKKQMKSVLRTLKILHL